MYQDQNNELNNQPQMGPGMAQNNPQISPMENSQGAYQGGSPYNAGFSPNIPQQSMPPKKKANNTGTKLVAVALCCALLGGVIGAGGIYAADFLLRGNHIGSSADVSNYLLGKRKNSVLNINEVDTSKEMSAAEVYAKNVNSTVGITTSITTNFWGYQTTSAASGSGFILSDDGYILTNYHVVEGSSAIKVSLYDGTTYEASVIGYDASNDIAVLKVEAKDLVPVVLGDSDNMNVGDEVLAIGNPLGELTFSLTSGSVSALDREITMQNGRSMNLIQTDAAINSGNSGGALFNMHGEVVGITNAKYSGNSGSGATIDNIGFAIPINQVWNIVQSIIEKGYISKPYLGISVSDVSFDAQAYGLPQGAVVRSVSEGGPAEKAGIAEKDIVTHLDDTQIEGSSHLISLVQEHEIGDSVKLTVYRQGETLEITVKIGEQVQDAQQMPH